MKRASLRTITALLLLAAPACYEFDFPLDVKREVKVDERLLGSWGCLSSENDADGGRLNLTITKSDATTMSFKADFVSDDDKKEGTTFDVYGSTLAPGRFLNVRDTGEKADGKWSFIRYSLLLPNVLRIELVNDEPFKDLPKNQALLRSAIQKRIGDPSVYSEYCVCVRFKPKTAN